MSTCIAPRCKAPREVGAVFCVEHLKAPSGTRGGWLSAEKRRRRMNGSMDTPIDASNIVTRLWIGGKPPFDRDLPEFDVVVLCARELQPERTAFHGSIVRCPLEDGILSRAEVNRALTAARAVANAQRQGKRTLVTCHMGINRSALVTGLAIGMNYRLSAPEIVELIRRQRNPICLSNTHFLAILHTFVGQWRAQGGS